MKKSSGENSVDSTSRRLGDGTLAIGVLIGVLLSLLLFVFWGTISTWLAKEQAVELVPATAALLVALTSLLIAYNALVEQRRMRQAGTDPVVLVHLEKRADDPSMIQLAISNVGAGAALNVRAKLKNSDDVASERVLTKLDKLGDHAVRVIRQSESIGYPLHVGNKLLTDPPLPPFGVTVEYENIEGRRVVQSFEIDVRELNGQSAYKPPETRIARALEKIRDVQSKMVNQDGSIDAVIETLNDKREREEKEFAEMLARSEARQAKGT